MKRVSPMFLLALLGAASIVLSGFGSCGSKTGSPPAEPAGVQPAVVPYAATAAQLPVAAAGVDPAVMAAGTGPAATAQPAPPEPAIPPKPEGSNCITWTPKNLLADADTLTSEVKDKSIVALPQISCRSGMKSPLPCDTGSCEAWVRYLSYDALIVYQAFEVDKALTEALQAVKAGKECGLTGKHMARAYVGLGYILADAKGEMLKASNAFRWGMLHEWDVVLPFPEPPPAVQMAFKAARSSMGTSPVACTP